MLVHVTLVQRQDVARQGAVVTFVALAPPIHKAGTV